MSLEVVAPLAGRLVSMEEVSDPVFAQGLVGPGVALVPDVPGTQQALSPIAGRILKMHPHAFVVVSDAGPAVLVHLGIDTVRLEGAGFTLLHDEGDTVSPGEPVTSWDPDSVRAQNLDPVVPVVLMNLSGQDIDTVAQVGHPVSPGQVILRLS